MLELFFELFANDREMGRRFDTDAHAATLDPDDSDGDLIANEETLANFAAEYQHVRTPLLEQGPQCPHCEYACHCEDAGAGKIGAC